VVIVEYIIGVSLMVFSVIGFLVTLKVMFPFRLFSKHRRSYK